MSIESDLYSHLSTYAGLTALIGKRIHPMKAPQDVTKPYCVFQQISGQREYSHGGFSNLSRPRIQVSCYSTTAIQVKQVAEQVTAAIEAWPAANASVQAVFYENELDAFEDATGLFHVPVDFMIWYG